MDDRAVGTTSGLAAKVQQLFDRAGLNECFDKGDSVGIKVHMGDWFNTAYVRPIFVRAIVDKVKEYGGRPFVTDTTTAIWPGGARADPVMHIETASANGFNRDSMGCPIIIADGSGYDDVRIDLPDGIILKEAYLARTIANADAMIVLTHFKGHSWPTFGGAIKNVGVGFASKRGKIYTHLALHPKVGLPQWKFDGSKCRGKDCKLWTFCMNQCPMEAIKVLEDRMEWNPKKCIGCLSHIFSPAHYICNCWTQPEDFVTRWAVPAIADAATAIMRFLDNENIKVGHLSLAIDITPACDCLSYSDRPIIPNLGVFASKDMVAIDTAALDMADKSPIIPGSAAEEKNIKPKEEKFTAYWSRSQWILINACERMGAGSKKYELVKVGPAPDEEEDKFWFPDLSFEKPMGYFFRKRFKIQKPEPQEGWKWREKPRIPVEELLDR
jgi:hypothetical protein